MSDKTREGLKDVVNALDITNRIIVRSKGFIDYLPGWMLWLMPRQARRQLMMLIDALAEWYGMEL